MTSGDRTQMADAKDFSVLGWGGIILLVVIAATTNGICPAYVIDGSFLHHPLQIPKRSFISRPTRSPLCASFSPKRTQAYELRATMATNAPVVSALKGDIPQQARSLVSSSSSRGAPLPITSALILPFAQRNAIELAGAGDCAC